MNYYISFSSNLKAENHPKQFLPNLINFMFKY